jgi:GNAT superfamily N-acetyltransferase
VSADDVEISTDRARVDVDVVHDFLRRSSYWALGRPREVVERTIANSLCFGAYAGGKMVGFGRVITDHAVIGYVVDVFVVPEARGRGIGKALVRAMVEHPTIAGLQVVLLRTTDARSLYTQFGFAPVPRPEELMGRYRELGLAPGLPEATRKS